MMVMARKPAIFFDRDGVLVELIGPDFARGPRTLKELRIYDDAPSALEEIKDLGFLIFVVTNQPDISRGEMSWSEYQAVSDELTRKFPSIEKIYTCSHDNDDNCNCRKPRWGMIEFALSDFPVEASSSWIVGDKWTDILAGKKAGLKTVLIENARSWEPTSQGSPPPSLSPDFKISSIGSLRDIINCDV
jgi:D-glycero-D-manno-heptose 1,7-bisphosphate phosphatase